jgi:hypothetical protein
MPAPLTIRSVVPADFTQWQHLWEHYNRFYERDAFPKVVCPSVGVPSAVHADCFRVRM